MVTNDIIVERLKNLIKAKGLTVNSFAKSIGIYQSRLQRILTRKIDSIGIDLLLQISDKYDVPIDYFIHEDDKQTKPESLKSIKIKDPALISLQEKLSAVWGMAREYGKGFLSFRFEQVFAEYSDILKRRTASETTPPHARIGCNIICLRDYI